jgi:hypothetical protein
LTKIGIPKSFGIPKLTTLRNQRSRVLVQHDFEILFNVDWNDSYTPGPTSSADSDDDPAWKKAKQEMITKHTNITSPTNRELQQYRCISTASDDLLQWWKRQAETFPKLSLLAQGILVVPATNAPSDRVFSTAGLVLQAKRSSMAPENMKKIIFVDDSAHYLQ